LGWQADRARNEFDMRDVPLLYWYIFFSYFHLCFLLILLQVMALRWRMFLGGPALFIGTTSIPMASIGGTGQSGMRFGTSNESRTCFQRKRLVFHSPNLPGGPNWKGPRPGNKWRSVFRRSRHLLSDGMPFTFYAILPFIHSKFPNYFVWYN